MAEEKHLVLFQIVSAGQNGAELGSDEEQIVYLLYAIHDVQHNKVVGQNYYHVKPSNSDINENLLSEQCRTDYGLTEVTIKEALPLAAVIHRFNAELSSRGLDPETVCLVTDGQLPIRQCLFPEAQRKGITLPAYYSKFHDLRKEFSAAYPDSPVSEVEDMLKILDLSVDNDLLLAERQMQAMAKVLHKLICDGVKLHEPDRVVEKLEQSIRSREDSVDSNCCVRSRGLPWQASDQDIARFFIGLNVARGGVALCLSSQGRRNGEAIVLFDNAQHRDLGLKRHKHHIGNRYIEVYKATGEDFINVAGGNNADAQKFLSRPAQVIIRMRGLPYDSTSKQVIEFFASGDNACSLVDGEDGVLFVKKPDGRATGDAFVLLAVEHDAEKALQKHKENMGSRYIELFRSTTAEVQQVLNRTMEKHSNNGGKNNGGGSALNNGLPGLPAPSSAAVAAAAAAAAATNIPLIPHLPTAAPPAVAMPVSVLPQQMITAGTRKDCIRLRGLPYEAQVEHILEFLGDHAQSIVYQGVHMVYNAQGQPSGEAFIQMSSEGAAYQSSQQRHHHNMAFGKKQRYIEVFQCSGEDMNHVLTGGATQSAAASAASSAVAVGHPAVSGQTAGLAPSPVKTSTHTTPTTGSNAATVAAVAAANGLLPPGMFTNAGAAPHQSAVTSHTQAGHPPFGHTAAGLAAADPNSAILAAAQQMQSPFLQFALPPQPQTIRTTQADMVNLQNSQMAGLFSLANMQNHNIAAAAHAQLRPPQLTAAPALMAFNPLAQMQQQQLFAQQQQLLQHQLAAQRLMLTTPPTSAAHPAMHGSGQPGLIGPRPPPPPPQSNTHGFGAHAAIAHAQAAAAAAKRSFDQAFTAAGHDPTDPSKRASYGTPTISAGPTTYHSR